MFAAYGQNTMRNAKFKVAPEISQADLDFAERRKRRELIAAGWALALDRAAQERDQIEFEQKRAAEIQRRKQWQALGLTVPERVALIVKEVAAKHGVDPLEIYQKCRRRVIVKARNEVYYRIKEARPELSFPVIGRWFKADHTTIMHGIAAHAHLTGEPSLTTYDITRQRSKKAHRSRTRYMWKEFQEEQAA